MHFDIGMIILMTSDTGVSFIHHLSGWSACLAWFFLQFHFPHWAESCSKTSPHCSWRGDKCCTVWLRSAPAAMSKMHLLEAHGESKKTVNRFCGVVYWGCYSVSFIYQFLEGFVYLVVKEVFKFKNIQISLNIKYSQLSLVTFHVFSRPGCFPSSILNGAALGVRSLSRPSTMATFMSRASSHTCATDGTT